MTRTCIVVADASRARLFLLTRQLDGGELHETMTETTDLVNPARRMRPSELFTESRSGIDRSRGLQYGIDDHRDAHVDHIDAEFGRLVIRSTSELLQESRTDRLVLCASPRMLGTLRATDGLPRGTHVDEIDRDLVKLTAPQLRVYLSDRGLLPAPPRRGLDRSA